MQLLLTSTWPRNLSDVTCASFVTSPVLHFPQSARLPKVGFVEYTDPLAFGFLDPSLVVRGCHLVPAFADGKTSSLLPLNPTAACSPDKHEDWVSFYVMMYVFSYVPHIGALLIRLL